jgi:hypothetical protein
VRGSLTEPAGLWAWTASRRDQPAMALALVAIVVAGGLGVATATEIGVRVFNTEWNAVAGYAAQRQRGWGPFMHLWAAAALLPVVHGLAGAWLLPMYGRPRDWQGGVAVGVLGAVPLYIAGLALVLLPGVLLVCIAFLVSCAWWGSGARLLLGLPSGDAPDYVVASIIASSVVLSLLFALVPLG